MDNRRRVGSFRIFESIPRENVLTYRRTEIVDGTSRILITGTDVVKHLAEAFDYTAAQLEERVIEVQLYGPERDIHIQCQNAIIASEILHRTPKLYPMRREYIGNHATPDIYQHKPRSIRVYLREVPLTMSNEDLKKEMKNHCNFSDDTPMYHDTYRGDFSKIRNGVRFIHVKEILYKAGVPLRLNIKGRVIFTHHFGQEKTPILQQEKLWK